MVSKTMLNPRRQINNAPTLKMTQMKAMWLLNLSCTRFISSIYYSLMPHAEKFLFPVQFCWLFKGCLVTIDSWQIFYDKQNLQINMTHCTRFNISDAL
jgi:hypothetical protein